MPQNIQEDSTKRKDEALAQEEQWCCGGQGSKATWEMFDINGDTIGC